MTEHEPSIMEAWGLTILLVEDSDMIAQIIEFLAQKAGCRFIRACNGQEGVECAKTQHPDLILMDLQMPIMDGMEAVHCIRAWEAEQPSHPHVPIYAFTAKCGPGQQELCLRNGFDGFFSKPLPVTEFFDLVRKIARGKNNPSTSPSGSP